MKVTLELRGWCGGVWGVGVACAPVPWEGPLLFENPLIKHSVTVTKLWAFNWHLNSLTANKGTNNVSPSDLNKGTEEAEETEGHRIIIIIIIKKEI